MTNTASKPIYELTSNDITDGIWRNGIFHQPTYSVYRNNEPIHTFGSVQTAHSYRVAHDIKLHLEAVSDDEYTLKVTSWKDMSDYECLAPSESALA